MVSGARRVLPSTPRLAALAILVVVAVGCGRASPPAPRGPPPHRAFYYWRTAWRLGAEERAALARLAIDRLYVRVFDVVDDLHLGPRIEAPLVIPTAGGPADGPAALAGIELVPVVFLREAVFRRVALADAAVLATKVWAAVAAQAAALGGPPRELQLDCDWSEPSRAAYFAFLDALRAAAPPGLVLSATIRLHQVKYRERIGVPPVDRGMLMFYNMGEFTAEAGPRALFDEPSARRYLERIAAYPRPLDVALPIFGWAVHVRDDRVVGLLQSVDPDELPGLDFVAPRGPDRFEVTRSGFLHGELLRQGDQLKIEAAGSADLAAAIAMLRPRLPAVSAARTITLFDLSERNLHHHALADLAATYRSLP
jgi:hypothetical protein